MLKQEEQACTLGEMVLTPGRFFNLETVFASFEGESFTSLSQGRRSHEVAAALLQLIQSAPPESFLLAAVIDFLDRVVEEELLDVPYTFGDFELWLNAHSGLTAEENFRVRGQIVGKYLPRDEYQAYFPVGLGQVHAGTHFVSAHHPPDLDTAVASFWGWVDAFGARVGDGLHVWNFPDSSLRGIVDLFTALFGSALFSILPRRSSSLGVRAMDLLSQEGLQLASGEARTSDLDHNMHQKLIVALDDLGRFLGSWRSGDVEGYRLVCLLMSDLWRWFALRASSELTQALRQPVVRASDVEQLIHSLLLRPLEAADLHERHLALLEKAVMKMFGLSDGLRSTFGDLLERLPQYAAVRAGLLGLSRSSLFRADGSFCEERSVLLGVVQALFTTLTEASEAFRDHLERLDVALQMKHEVLGLSSPYVFAHYSVDDVIEAMGPFSHLPVVEMDKEGHLFVMGAIHRSRLQQHQLGTITLRDFCNRDEVKIAEHLEVISVVDHHRANLNTSSFPTAIIGDVQSSNTLLAEQAFQINDRYGGSLLKVEQPLSLGTELTQLRRTQRLVAAQLAAQRRGPYFVHKDREQAEYLCFLHAILDDTDLLSRVSARDVLCVAELLNRLKSLQMGTYVEVVTLDDLPRDAQFATRAARRLLKNEELYSLYSHIYALRQTEVSSDLEACVAGEASAVFADTKEQKGIACVGQIKVFPKNFVQVCRIAPRLRRIWLTRAREVAGASRQLDLHLQMVSMIAGAEEVYRGVVLDSSYEDQLWIWAAPTQQGYDHLGVFLRAFRHAPEVTDNCLSVTLCGRTETKLRRLFSDQFAPVEVRIEGGDPLGDPNDEPMALLRFQAGSLTSRKASITPYIPTIEN